MSRLPSSFSNILKMVKHIVMWKVRGDTAETKQRNAEFVKEQFEGLVGKIDGMLKLEVGLDLSNVEYACDVVLYTEFDTADSLKAYASHPAHLKVRGELGDVRISRHQVDYV